MANLLSDEDIRLTLAAIKKVAPEGGHINRAALAIELGIARSTALNRLASLSKMGLLDCLRPAMPGFEIDSVQTSLDKDGNTKSQSVKQSPFKPSFIMPEGHRVKGVSSLVRGDGSLIQEWVKTEKAKPDPEEYAAKLEAAFANFTPAAPYIPAPIHDFTNQLTLYPWSDPHFGAYIWHGDTEQNWDLDIAVHTFVNTFGKVISRSPASKRALLLIGGDTLHADNNDNETPRSGHTLQVDGRHAKVFITACQTIATVAQMLLTRHEDVEIIVLQGNHDETSASPVAFFLWAYFRNEPRVTVDVSAHLFRFRQFGRVMLAFTHGHTVKMQDMPTIMAAYAPKMWGETDFRFAHTFHIHHKKLAVYEGNACITESHEVLVPADAWHYGAGYKSQRSQQSVTYDPDRGETGRAREAIL